MLLDDGTGKTNQPRVALPVRVPKPLLDYVRKRAGAKRGEVTRVIEEALQLHQKLFELLSDHEDLKFRLQRYASDEKLDWSTQEAEVYARLIVRGLEDSEKKRK